MALKPTEPKPEQGKEVRVKASRLDGVVDHPDGGITVNYTEGDHPLSGTASGEGLAHLGPDGRSQLIQAIREAELRIAADLKFIQIAKAYKADPTMGATFRAACTNKTATIDLDGTAGTVTLG